MTEKRTVQSDFYAPQPIFQRFFRDELSSCLKSEKFFCRNAKSIDQEIQSKVVATSSRGST